jgi:DNA-binding IclR family transcriptional regulator
MDVAEGTLLPEGGHHAQRGTWTFMTNHAHVLFCLAQNPTVRLREVATRVGITERAVQRIVHDLQEGEYINVLKEGRRNRYEVNVDLPLRHEVERHCTVSDLLELVCSSTSA